MTLTITIDLDNDAFQPDASREVKRILTAFGQRLCLDDQRDEWKLQDANGNTVGTAKLDE
jgi:hypothetical protein